MQKIKHFTKTSEIDQAYGQLITQSASTKFGDDDGVSKSQQAELVAIAKHEQLNVLQPVIYDDLKLKESLDLNHTYSRRFTDKVTPYLQLIFSATQSTNDPTNIVRFDPPTGFMDQMMGTNKSLADKNDRMDFVQKIANRFNIKMAKQKEYMETEIAKISDWYL